MNNHRKLWVYNGAAVICILGIIFSVGFRVYLSYAIKRGLREGVYGAIFLIDVFPLLYIAIVLGVIIGGGAIFLRHRLLSQLAAERTGVSGDKIDEKG